MKFKGVPSRTFKKLMRLLDRFPRGHAIRLDFFALAGRPLGLWRCDVLKLIKQARKELHK
jgi:hypothetical protein